MSAVQRLADVLALHRRVNPPGGLCSCGHETPLGERVTEHQVRVLLSAEELLPALVEVGLGSWRSSADPHPPR